MATSVVMHHVKDYSAWRKVYDGFAPVQKAGGVIAQSVYQSKGDPNNVLVLHRFATMAEAEAFFQQPDLLNALREAGVEGTPHVEFYDEA